MVPLSIERGNMGRLFNPRRMETMERRRNTVETMEDGEKIVRYWSVYEQTWRTSVPEGIPDVELSAMDPEEREEIIALREL